MTYPADQWADICEFAGVWQRGQKCNAYFDLFGRCIRCGIEHNYLDPPTHDLRPPDQSDPKIRAWVAMECIEKLKDSGKGYQPAFALDYRWTQLKLSNCWVLLVGNFCFDGGTAADAIFAAVAAHLREQGR